MEILSDETFYDFHISSRHLISEFPIIESAGIGSWGMARKFCQVSLFFVFIYYTIIINNTMFGMVIKK